MSEDRFVLLVVDSCTAHFRTGAHSPCACVVDISIITSSNGLPLM
jgi:hypothetical protein